MAGIFKHKLLLLCIAAGGVYWFINPPQRFGIVKPGFVVYNKIPVVLFDCYISTDGKLYLQESLRKSININYWRSTHLSSYKGKQGTAVLIIGSGFDGKSLPINNWTLEWCSRLHYEPRIYSSREAIAVYNKLRDSGRDVAILLRVKE